MRHVIACCLLLAGCGTTAPKKGDPQTVLRAAEDAGKRPIEKTIRVDGPSVIIANATIMTATGKVLSPGWIAFDKGRITSVGEGEAKPLKGAHIIDAKGHFVTPGLIDTHSHLMVYPSPSANAHSDGNEMTGPMKPGVWAEHAAWPQDPGLELAMAGGITTLHVLPGSGNLIGGRGVTLHLVPHRGARAMRFPGAPDTLKMACGENPKRVYGRKKQMPSTRMGNLHEQRSAYLAAKEAMAKLMPGMRNLANESLMGVLRGDILLQVHCYRADDMLTFLQLADEAGFAVRSFHHGLEAYKIRDILAERKVAVSTWADWWGFKMEAFDGIPENAAMVHAAGAKVVIHSDSATGIQRLNQEAGKAMYSGRRVGIEISDEDALRWITVNAAWVLGIDAHVGTLEVGKIADLVVWDQHPFSVYASARWVFVDGVLRHSKDRSDPPWSDFQLGQEVQP